MPKRLIDGEAIWGSQKLKKVSVKYRGHFQAILPLAEANGVFEADPELVWSRVFSFNRPDVLVEDVIQFLDEFESAGMISRWQQDSKLYAIFNGINKTGRLPVESHLKRYKNLPPNPPQDLSRTVPDNPGTCPEGLVRFGLGKVGFGMEEPEEENMSATSKIKKLAGTKLGWVGFIGQGESAVLNQLALAYGGEQELAAAFDEWIAIGWDGILADPIRSFIKYAKENVGIARETKQLTDDRLKPLLVKVYTVSGQSPAGKSKSAAEMLLKEYSPEEIITAFSEDYANRDEFRAKNAVREFFELGGGEAIILAIRERKQKESTETELLARERVILAEESAKELAILENEAKIAYEMNEFFLEDPKPKVQGV